MTGRIEVLQAVIHTEAKEQLKSDPSLSDRFKSSIVLPAGLVKEKLLSSVSFCLATD